MLLTNGMDSGVIGTYEGDVCHLAFLFARVTACGKGITGDIPLGNEVEITCPDCIAEIEYRKANPEASRQECGVVTHKLEAVPAPQPSPREKT